MTTTTSTSGVPLLVDATPGLSNLIGGAGISSTFRRRPVMRGPHGWRAEFFPRNVRVKHPLLSRPTCRVGGGGSRGVDFGDHRQDAARVL